MSAIIRYHSNTCQSTLSTLSDVLAHLKATKSSLENAPGGYNFLSRVEVLNQYQILLELFSHAVNRLTHFLQTLVAYQQRMETTKKAKAPMLSDISFAHSLVSQGYFSNELYWRTVSQHDPLVSNLLKIGYTNPVLAWLADLYDLEALTLFDNQNGEYRLRFLDNADVANADEDRIRRKNYHSSGIDHSLSPEDQKIKDALERLNKQKAEVQARQNAALEGSPEREAARQEVIAIQENIDYLNQPRTLDQTAVANLQNQQAAYQAELERLKREKASGYPTPLQNTDVTIRDAEARLRGVNEALNTLYYKASNAEKLDFIHFMEKIKAGTVINYQGFPLLPHENHTALGTGEGVFIEAPKIGLPVRIKSAKYLWDTPTYHKEHLTLYEIPGIADWQRQSAVEYAKKQIQKPYNWFNMFPTTTNDWYCTKLVLGSLQQAGINFYTSTTTLFGTVYPPRDGRTAQPWYIPEYYVDVPGFQTPQPFIATWQGNSDYKGDQR